MAARGRQQELQPAEVLHAKEKLVTVGMMNMNPSRGAA
jgi:hypothetical protein